MTTSDATVLPALPATGRSGFLARIGAVLVGAAAAGTLAGQRRAAAAAPVCCVGPNSCGSFGCTCPNPGSGGCCWYCSVPSQCKIYQCCDRTCGGHACICNFLICHGCC